MHAYYIGCDQVPTENNSQIRLQCNYSVGATAYTEAQVSEFYAPQLTAADGYLYAGVIFTVSLLSWGFRLALKQYNLGL